MSFTVTSPRGTTYLRIDDPPYALTQRPVPARSNSDRNSSPDQHAPPAVPMLPQLTKNTSATLTTASSSSGRLVPKRKMKLLLTYGADWVVTIIIIIIFYLLDEIEGFKRQFSLTDTSIQHTFAVHERVPPWLLYIVALIAPAVIMPIVNLLTVRSWWDWHNSWLGLLLGLGTTGSLTQVVKVTVGRPRPDLLDRCQPRAGVQDRPVYGLVTADICTTDNHERLKDGFRSFFSGHSSLTFAGLGFLSFYLAGKMHLFDERGHTGKAWIALAPLTGALLVAISRTMDYRHHWQDVLIGSIVGLVLSYFSYRQYYPSLASPFSHRPYSPRIPRYEQDQAGIPSPEPAPAAAPVQSGPAPVGESIELEGTVKRGGQDLSDMYKKERDGERSQNQQQAVVHGDASQQV
ncbi:Diacylglycerol pyrophosphate phosphatase 1 OS=Saccharomyces cerevisiae (strain ATCC 204508 / S288c) GN=DPP1 PE=1 SV=1 [Rhizoctonia solani AG-1 IB]|uniref:Diacylglycerol pyrophosphate phosphatase 1 n=1 Tax=Thanatephorus cucumeris (strain AG1-IB / isolate 7/3/14) TaxID=1108050 RepID=A0A0B7F455_THACB|nr:Diacylglycerol pyrophosphate phosphatase 1 OS=Saccharomyces cerevisiae (strain ATCC 204508 / S288c) GN=DPP1 PE=1 SV=1 [Rhizoctonia solani AG-1 IB]